jgi:hypothetical protein
MECDPRIHRALFHLTSVHTNWKVKLFYVFIDNNLQYRYNTLKSQILRSQVAERFGLRAASITPVMFRS